MVADRIPNPRHEGSIPSIRFLKGGSGRGKARQRFDEALRRMETEATKFIGLETTPHDLLQRIEASRRCTDDGDARFFLERAVVGDVEPAPNDINRRSVAMTQS